MFCNDDKKNKKEMRNEERGDEEGGGEEELSYWVLESLLGYHRVLGLVGEDNSVLEVLLFKLLTRGNIDVS